MGRRSGYSLECRDTKARAFQFLFSLASTLSMLEDEYYWGAPYVIETNALFYSVLMLLM